MGAGDVFAEVLTDRNQDRLLVSNQQLHSPEGFTALARQVYTHCTEFFQKGRPFCTTPKSSLFTMLNQLFKPLHSYVEIEHCLDGLNVVHVVSC
ncbi:hypothetical protein D3C86_1964250 [compost metagenome]